MLAVRGEIVLSSSSSSSTITVVTIVIVVVVTRVGNISIEMVCFNVIIIIIIAMISMRTTVCLIPVVVQTIFRYHAVTISTIATIIYSSIIVVVVQLW